MAVSWVVAKMKWIMLVSGVLTCTMVYGSKVPFVALLLTYGGQYLGQQAAVSIAIDLAMVLLFIVYLFATRRNEVRR